MTNRDEDWHAIYYSLIFMCLFSMMMSQCEQVSKLDEITEELRFMNSKK